MGFKLSADLYSYEEGRKKMGLGRSTDLKLYKNKGIEPEKTWISSEVQFWTLMKREEKR